jgi:transcriptional regulator with XRE-family HTH domain
LRALRHERGFTLDELSARSGVSRRMIALLEAGDTNASLATLDKLARALGTSFGSLVLPEQAVPLAPEEPAGAPPLWEDGFGSSARLLLSYPRLAGAEVWRWDLAAGARYEAEPDPPGSEALVVVSSGRVVVEAGGKRAELGPGSYLRAPADRGYAYANLGDRAASFVTVLLQPTTNRG